MRSSPGFDALDGRTAAAIWRAGSGPRKKGLTAPDCILDMVRPVREGALPEAFESGAASARGADPQGSPIAAVASVGDEPVAVDAASPPSQGGVSGFSASRSPARNMGAPP